MLAEFRIFSGYELGWIAWAVGGLVGFGVLLGSGGEKSSSGGVVAVAIAVIALMAAKYTTVQLLLSDDTEITEAERAKARTFLTRRGQRIVRRLHRVDP